MRLLDVKSRDRLKIVISVLIWSTLFEESMTLLRGWRFETGHRSLCMYHQGNISSGFFG